MEAAWLRSQLASGRSIESIAREAGRHPSTVAYWVNKHGLDVIARATSRAAAAACPEAELSVLVQDGLTVRADRGAPRSRTHDRALLARAVRTQDRARSGTRDAPSGAGRRSTVRSLPHPRPDAVRSRATTGAAAGAGAAGSLLSRRGAAAIKQILVAEAGGACALCGYDRYPGGAPLPPSRSGGQGVRAGGRRASRDRSCAARAEVAKCVLAVRQLPCRDRGVGSLLLLPSSPADYPCGRQGRRYTGRG